MNIELPECLQAETGISSLRSALNPALADSRTVLRLVLKSRTDLQNCYIKSKELLLAGKSIYSAGVQLTSIAEIHTRYLERLAELEGFERLALLPTFSEAAGSSLEQHESEPDAFPPEFVKRTVLDSSLYNRVARIVSDRRTIREHINYRLDTPLGAYRMIFKDKLTAEWAIGVTLTFYEPLISQWLLKSTNDFKTLWHFLCLHLPIFEFSIPIGEMVTPDGKPHTAMSIKVVLVRHPFASKGFFVKTAFPTMPLGEAKCRFDNLQIFCSYFVPGWEADFETMAGAIDFFALTNKPDAKHGLTAEIDLFLNVYFQEDQRLEELLKRGCHHNPCQLNSTCSEWLNSVKLAVGKAFHHDDSSASTTMKRNLSGSPILSIASILVKEFGPIIKSYLELWIEHKEREAAEKRFRELTWEQVTDNQRKAFNDMLALLATREPGTSDFASHFLHEISEHQKAQLVVRLVQEDPVAGAENLSNVIRLLKGTRSHSARIDLLTILGLLR